MPLSQKQLKGRLLTAHHAIQALLDDMEDDNEPMRCNAEGMLKIAQHAVEQAGEFLTFEDAATLFGKGDAP